MGTPMRLRTRKLLLTGGAVVGCLVLCCGLAFGPRGKNHSSPPPAPSLGQSADDFMHAHPGDTWRLAAPALLLREPKSVAYEEQLRALVVANLPAQTVVHVTDERGVLGGWKAVEVEKDGRLSGLTGWLDSQVVEADEGR